ncbi:7-methylguanosine phosphate-specific 5'-nucleotidase-like [Hylobates moloch]|uniref:7-methylguanosine phosphate-specific 5'-nucleotidase-like n=1 Tax=Hylobates moloch TaxID=81572 RepID=UPI001362A369|nr:7-methylguanosine phosphate-specific 5'-nucleotidase-like [Hylobates moloch]
MARSAWCPRARCLLPEIPLLKFPLWKSNSSLPQCVTASTCDPVRGDLNLGFSGVSVSRWTKAHNLLCQQKIQKFQIAQVVRESNAMLREGYKAFFNTLYHNNIPLFIFSAGIGDILEEIIRQMKVFHPNIHIVSNYMDFNEDGFLQGFKGQLIHTYNKNSSVCENSGYFQQLEGKTNVILLGDSIGDLTMADGVPGVQNILKIGFLNDKVGRGPGLLLFMAFFSLNAH